MPARLRYRLRSVALATVVAVLTALVVRPATAAVPVAAEIAHALPAPIAEVLFDEEFSVRSGGRLAVDLTSEDVIVETTRGSRARVRVEGEGRDARAEFQRRRFSADASGRTLTVRTNPPRSSGWRMGRTNARFTVTISIPERFDALIDMGSGDVSVESLTGDLRVDTGSGDVDVQRVRGGTIVLDTGSGDVQATSLAGSAIRIDTGSGDVDVQTVEGPLTVDTGSGDVAIRSADGAVNVDTGSGDVSIAMRRVAEARIDTGSGSVTLALPRGANATLAAESNGGIQIDDRLDFEGRQQRREAAGRIGRGGPRLAIDTGSGGVRLLAR